jgi:uncharacterized protein YciI
MVMQRVPRMASGLAALLVAGACLAQDATAPATRSAADPAVAPADAPPAYDAALARSLGADEHGMRRYVLVILKTGPTPLPRGEARDAMFKGHFANINRLADEGTLVLAGPLDGVDGRRGIFILDAADIAEARALVATDPVVANGEMTADFHVYYGSAALKMVNDTHARISRDPP